MEKLPRALGAKGGQYSAKFKLRLSGSNDNFVGGNMVPTCDASFQTCYQDSYFPLEDGQWISLEEEENFIVWRVKRSSSKVLEWVIPKLLQHSLSLEFLFLEMDDGRNKVLEVGNGGCIGGKLEL